MRMTVLSLLAGLALCSTATAAVMTSNSRAEQPARKPMMIAQAGSPRDPQMDRERQPSCSDISADKQEDMRWLESRLSLTQAQAPLFARWRQVALDIARRNQAECTAHQRNASRAPSLPDGLAEEEAMLRGRLADLQTERPVLEAFYRALTQSQRNMLEQQGGEGAPPPPR
jgi:hypothetical protein